MLSRALGQRCDAHFLRNALDYLPRRAKDGCLQKLRWIDERRDIEDAQRDLAAWIANWQGMSPKLIDWVESNIAERLAFYRLPRALAARGVIEVRRRLGSDGHRDLGPNRTYCFFPKLSEAPHLKEQVGIQRLAAPHKAAPRSSPDGRAFGFANPCA